MEKVNDVDTLRCPQTWLAGKSHICRRFSTAINLHLQGVSIADVWLARVEYDTESQVAGPWKRCCWIVITCYHWHYRFYISFVVTATNTCHPVVVGYMDSVKTARWHQPILIIVPHLATVGSSRMARCCWTKKLKSLSKRQSLNSWLPHVINPLPYQHL